MTGTDHFQMINCVFRHEIQIGPFFFLVMRRLFLASIILEWPSSMRFVGR